MRRGDINMKKMLKKSKGFTLVELLIVIIIIGILAGMMMLSTGGATAKAEATKIVSDMRNMKAAAIMVYADNSVWPTDIRSLDNYLDQNPSGSYSIPTPGAYLLFNATSTDQKIKDNLKVMATTGGLPLFVSVSPDVAYDGTNSMYMPIK